MIDERIQQVHRGERVTQVRVDLGLNGAQFARVLENCLRALGVVHHYDKAKVSRIESGARRLSAEEAVIIAHVDPKQRSLWWLTFGKPEPARDGAPPTPGPRRSPTADLDPP